MKNNAPASGLSALLSARISETGQVLDPTSTPPVDPPVVDPPKETTPPVGPPVVDPPKENTPPVDPPVVDPPKDKTPATPLSVEDFINDVVPPVESGPGDEEDEVVPPEIEAQGPKAAAAWKNTRAEVKDLKRQLAEKGTTAPATDPAQENARIQELEQALQDHQARVAEQERIIAAIHVEESVEYQREVLHPIQALEARLRGYAEGDADVEEQLLDAAMQTNLTVRARKLQDVADNLPDLVRHTLYSDLNELDRLYAKDAEMKANAVTLKQSLDMQKLSQQGEMTAKQRQAFDAASDTVWQHIQTKIPGVLDEQGVVIPAFQKAREAARGLDPGDPSTSLGARAFAGFATQLVPLLTEQLQSQSAKIAELKQAMADLTGASPRKTPSAQVTTPPTSVRSGSGRSLKEALGNAIENGGVTFPGR